MKEQEKNRLYTEKGTVRFTALLVFITASVVLITQNYWLSLLLTADFGLRAFTRYTSPLAIITKALYRIAPWSQQRIFAPPKRFAAAIGFVMSLGITAALYLQLPIPAYGLGGILLLCSFLESAFNVCLGCYLFAWIIAPIKNRQDTIDN